jgi:hypothetical protein
MQQARWRKIKSHPITPSDGGNDDDGDDDGGGQDVVIQ